MSRHLHEARLYEAIENSFGEKPCRLKSVGGGCINQAFVGELKGGLRIFIKTRFDAGPQTFEIEADGLRWLREGIAATPSNPLCVPKVLKVLSDPPALVLEAFEALPHPPTPLSEEALGRGIALLHRSLPPHSTFGYHIANDLGPLRLNNEPSPSWAEFYADRRLLPLFELLTKKRPLLHTTRSAFERLLDRLPDLLGPEEPPSRLHGDLWSGNVAYDSRGRPYIFDPAVFAGNREVDLAMMQLFGGFSPRVFAAYDEVFPRAYGHKERLPIYQLLPLIVHAILFGGGYVQDVVRIIMRFGG
ncbi:MAG: fructosamine kinase family protein [Deltaproteobacteria bacterium]|nr:fructosamine kinase family protein [Deltaproteobacteria bacterium]